MYLIDLEYQVPLEQVDAARDAHVAFLREQYAQGVFLFSGRKVPRSGGIILARGVTLDELDAILQKDPFRQQGLARYTVTEFVAGMTAPELAQFQEG
ncbi:MAG TPA: YciI family protein [Desulfuromonadales bacterium]|nr:YciI family protein [Desulfuromonadales bacterium]